MAFFQVWHIYLTTKWIQTGTFLGINFRPPHNWKTSTEITEVTNGIDEGCGDDGHLNDSKWQVQQQQQNTYTNKTHTKILCCNKSQSFGGLFVTIA